jgi:hypothetical protein
MSHPTPDQPDAPRRRSGRAAANPDAGATDAGPNDAGLNDAGLNDAGAGEFGRARTAELERLRGTLKRKFH